MMLVFVGSSSITWNFSESDWRFLGCLVVEAVVWLYIVRIQTDLPRLSSVISLCRIAGIISRGGGLRRTVEQVTEPLIATGTPRFLPSHILELHLHAIRYISYHGYIATIPLSYHWYKSMVLSMVNSQLYIATTTIRVRHNALTPKANVQTETLHFSLSSCQIRARYTVYNIHTNICIVFDHWELLYVQFCTCSFVLL